MNEILKLENDDIAVSMRDDATLSLRDKKNGADWNTFPCAFQERDVIVEDTVWVRRERFYMDNYPGYFKAEALRDRPGSAKVTLMGPPRREFKGDFVCSFSLDGPWLAVRITDIDERLPCLTFPSHIESSSLVMPDEIGKWFRSYAPSWESKFRMQNGGMNMRWFGGLKDDANRGWIAVLDEGFEDAGTYTNNIASAPCWLKAKGVWASSRTVRYAFTGAGYVGMAKIFRKYAIERGIHRSLAEKIRRTPAVANLVGGRIVSMFQSHTEHRHWYTDQLHRLPADIDREDGKLKVRFTHRDVAAIVADSKKRGMKKGVFNVRGTFAGGYDERHPDIWPPEPALGTMGELKSLLAEKDPYLVLLHDNVQDIYEQSPSFPAGVIKDNKGRLLMGGYWHGGLCYITCPKYALKNALRNWEQLAELSPRGHFIDTAACVQFYQCYDPDHPLVRAEDPGLKIEIMKFYKERGVVLGSENAGDYGVCELDFLENRHIHATGESIPLWPLVFHDAVICARYGTGGTWGGDPSGELETMLWGYAAFWPVDSMKKWRSQETAFRESLAVDEWHAKIALAEMTDHRYLCEDEKVERTEFSSGQTILVNFAHEPRTVDGKTVPARSKLVLD